MPMPDRRLPSTPQVGNGRVKAKESYTSPAASRKLRESAPDLFQCTEARNPTRLNPIPKTRARENAARAIAVEAIHRSVRSWPSTTGCADPVLPRSREGEGRCCSVATLRRTTGYRRRKLSWLRPAVCLDRAFHWRRRCTGPTEQRRSPRASLIGAGYFKFSLPSPGCLEGR